LGWLEENVAKPGQIVRGIIIARTISEKLRLSLRRVSGVEAYEYELKRVGEQLDVVLTRKTGRPTLIR